MTDFFDRLPDDIVVSIVDSLSLKDAATTSALSHRFRDVFLGRCKTLMHEKNLDLQDSTNFRFVDFVNHILQTHEGSKVDSLRISVVADFDSLKTKTVVQAKVFAGFESWLKFAKAKGVLELNLASNLSVTFPMFDDGWDKLTALSLKSVIPGDLERGLKSSLVNLESLCIEEALLQQNAIIKSPKLKRLKFRDCKSLWKIDIDSTPKLIQLEIRECYNVSTIEINSAPDLQCFKIYGNEPRKLISRLSFKHVPKLSNVYITGNYFDSGLLTEFNKAGMLEKLELVSNYRWIYPSHFPALPLLGTLKLYFTKMTGSCNPLGVFTDILASCPKLQKLTLDYAKWSTNKGLYDYDSFDLRRYKLSASSRRSSQYCLKEAEFIGWCGKENEDEVFDYLKQTALNLERLSLIAPNLEKLSFI